MTKPIYLFTALIALVFFSCKKDSLNRSSDARILVSADTLHFDTLFTGTGTVTQSVKLYNPNNQKLIITNISVAGGSSSAFQINADGFPGPEVQDLEMEANDSLYIFVTANIDPSAPGLPFVVQDSIRIAFNGNTRSVQLDAWGQNAHFLRSAVISSNTTWTSDRPYVILGSLQVKENAVLTLEKGTRVYLHGNAPLLVDGSLRATGDQTDSGRIIFSGDRLDQPYRDYPGAWPGLYFRQNSQDNLLRHVTIKNANQGVNCAGLSLSSNPKLTLDKCIIDNCYDAGLIGTHTDLTAINCVISNCGSNIELTGGGHYELTYCTVASYSNLLIAHKNPVLTISDQDSSAANTSLQASIRNCIFWGDNGIVPDEVVTDRQGTAPFAVGFQNCLWKITHAPQAADTSGMLENKDPLFLNIDTRNNVYDFHPDQSSPAVGAGIGTGITTDIDENPRNPDFPDIGAYQVSF